MAAIMRVSVGKIRHVSKFAFSNKCSESLVSEKVSLSTYWFFGYQTHTLIDIDFMDEKSSERVTGARRRKFENLCDFRKSLGIFLRKAQV